MESFAKTAEEQLQIISETVNQLYLDTQNDLVQLNKCQNSLKPIHSSILMPIQSEAHCAEQFIHIQELTGKVIQRIKHEYDPKQTGLL